ncbi:MAG: hypothetical protein ACI92G_004325 [Candidatus Pelagisphaera sp.]
MNQTIVLKMARNFSKNFRTGAFAHCSRSD